MQHSFKSCFTRATAIAFLALTVFSTGAFAATLTLNGYLDPLPAPGQGPTNGYVSATLSGTGPMGLDGNLLVTCLDYDKQTSGTATLTGTIVEAVTLDRLVQGYIFLANLALMSTPTHPDVDRMAYAIWDAKTGQVVPDVLGSAAYEALYRASFLADVIGNTAYVQAYTNIFQSVNSSDQSFIMYEAPRGKETPEPDTWVMGLGGLALVAVGRYRLARC